MIFALIGGALSILAWRAARDPGINFLSRDSRANWIVFPTAIDTTIHRFASLDAIFRREFVLSNLPRTARLKIRAARRCEVKVNGIPIADETDRNWKTVSNVNVTDLLRTDRNVIEVRVFNHTGPPALWLLLIADDLTLPTDQSWDTSFAQSAWRRAALASTPKITGAGNPIAGSEDTFTALAKTWPVWLIFVVIAAVIWIGATHWGRVRLFLSKPGLMAAVFVTTVSAILFWNSAARLPFHTGFDSQDHLAYINYVQEHQALPSPIQGYEMYQPPLYYVISAAALSLCGLSTHDPGAVLILRFITMLSSIAQIIFVFLSLRLLFPNRMGLQLVGLMLAAFLPIQLYLGHYVTNEMLAAALMTAAIYFALRFFQNQNASPRQSATLGLCIGAAMLAKATGILLLPIVATAVVIQLVNRRAPFGDWMQDLGVMLAVCFAVCGWYYIHIWFRFGTPLLGNWDVASGFAWWQEPGYRMMTDYIRFGRSLVRPLFSGLSGVPDGIYSTLWGDGLCGGVAGLAFRPPWNYQLMAAGYLLAVVPTLLIITGAIIAGCRLVRRPSVELVLLLGLSATIALGLIFMTLRVPSYAQAKAFYGSAILTPLCFFCLLGWEAITRGRKNLETALGIIMLVWAMNSYASVWIFRSAPQQLYVAQGLRAEGKIDLAESEAAKAVTSGPANASARRVHALALDDLGRNGEALEEAEHAVALDPTDSAAHLQLAMSAKLGQLQRAISEGRRAIELGPENFAAYKFLMGCLLESHENDEAIKLGYDWIAVSPFSADVHYALGLSLGEKGDLAKAANQFGYVMMLRPDLAQGHSQLRQALLSMASAFDGSKELHLVASEAPDSPRMLDELAWLFATHPDPNVRDGPEAIRLAERACILTDRRIAALLDTLAAAYAEAGKFPSAIRTAEEALALARSSGDTDGITLSDRILASVRQSLAYREEPIQE